MSRIYISVVIPVYGCETCLIQLYKRLKKTLEKITNDFELIMVNDASPDNAWAEIKKISKADLRVKGINLSRNFGQHQAIAAGLDYTEGDWVIVMDCDLQDQPEEILALYNKAQEGYDVVFGRRVHRQDSFFKKTSSKYFYKVYNFLTDCDTDQSIANFSIISSKVVNNLRKMKEQHKPYGYSVNWLGFSRANIDIMHASRDKGKSSYSFKKLMFLAVNNIISQSNKPLMVSIVIGFFMSFSSAVYAFYLVIRYFMSDITVAGWTSVMVSIFFLTGLVLANLGFMGLYIGKIFNETKNRPLYIVDETTF